MVQLSYWDQLVLLASFNALGDRENVANMIYLFIKVKNPEWEERSLYDPGKGKLKLDIIHSDLFSVDQDSNCEWYEHIGKQITFKPEEN